MIFWEEGEQEDMICGMRAWMVELSVISTYVEELSGGWNGAVKMAPPGREELLGLPY